ncbi:MAG: tyrosine-type recombinase/integrase, partial [Planctomycetota bacterium]
KESWKLGKMPAEEYHRAVDIKQVKNQKLPQGRVIHKTEVYALLNSCPNTSKGSRDRAIFAIMFGCGLRRSEVVKILFHHYESSTGELKIISGKGNKDRITYLPQGLKPVLDCWINYRGKRQGSLFCRIQKGNTLLFKALTTQAIYFILKEYALISGVSNISPHDSRRTYITSLLDEGVDVLTVQKLVGHANINTTLRYDRREEESKKKAVLKLHFDL